jgi:HK97 gp10 family phage protein
MPDAGSVTVTGLEAVRQAVQTLPEDVRQALHRVAVATATRVQAAAKATLASQLKTSRHALIDAITVADDAEHHQVQVRSAPPPGQDRMLPMFVEYGTVKMSARPYMRPAADGVAAQYFFDVDKASTAVVRKAIA